MTRAMAKMHGGRNDKNEHDEFLIFPEVRAISKSVTSAATMNIVRRFLHVPTRKKSVGRHVMFVVAIVATSVTLRRVAHATSDAIFVWIGEAAVFAFTDELADKNPLLLTHRHRVHPLPTFSANRLFRSLIPNMAVLSFVTHAFELAKLHFVSCGEQLTVPFAFAALRGGRRVAPATPAAVIAAKLSPFVSKRHTIASSSLAKQSKQGRKQYNYICSAAQLASVRLLLPQAVTRRHYARTMRNIPG